MKPALFCSLIIWTVTMGRAAQLQVMAFEPTQLLFPAGNRPLRLLFTNTNLEPVESQISLRLWQLSSSITMPAGDTLPWKKLTVLGGQTILEGMTLTFPEVRSATSFQVHWTDETNHDLGQTLVTVVPTNLLHELTVLAGGQAFGVLDPQERVTPLLKALQLDFMALSPSDVPSSFTGPFVIIWPAETTPRWSKRALAWAGRGVGVVLIGPQPAANSGWPGLLSSGRIVRTAAEAFPHFETNPSAQAHLLQCVRVTLNPHWLLSAAEP